LNKKLLIFGLLLAGVSMLLPKISFIFLNGIFPFPVSDENTKILNALETIFSHLTVIGFILGGLTIIGSLIYYHGSGQYIFKRIVPSTVLIISSIVVTLLAIETVLYFRFKDIQIGGNDSPSHYTFYKKYYSRNEVGFRDRERTIENPEGNYRIVTLGDSYTFGAGVRYIEELFTVQLEDYLNQGRSDKDRKIEVINTGMSGLSTAKEFKMLRTKGMLFAPDFLILAYVINDAESPEIKEEYSKEFGDWQLLPYPYGKILNRYSFSYYFLRDRLYSLVEGRKYPNRVRRPDIDKMYADENRKVHRKVFNELMEYCRQHNLEVLVVLFPDVRHIKDEEYPYPDVQDYIKEMTTENGMYFLDLLEPLRNSGLTNFMVSSMDSHPSAQVHGFAAKAIYEKLVKEKLAP